MNNNRRFGPRIARTTANRFKCYNYLLVFLLIILFFFVGVNWTPQSLPSKIISNKNNNKIIKESYPDEEKPLPKRIDLTFYATTKNLGVQQMTAIRSWLALGADVIVFADNLTDVSEIPNTISAETGLAEPDRFRLFTTPLPRSILGAPRLDLIMESGELLAKTEWVCMINGDIVVPKAFGDLIEGPFKSKDIIGIGERLDCRINPNLSRLPKSVNSFEDLENWSMAPCWPHGSGGKDYYLYRKGLFQRHHLEIPPFWIGKYVWDHWLVNVTHDFAVDLSPALLVGHFSHEYEWNWRLVHDKQESITQKKKAKLDIDWNQQIIHCDNIPIFKCLPYQSTYDVAFQLCPGNVIQSMPKDAATLYAKSIATLRLKLKPKDNSAGARRVYETPALTGESPSYWAEGILPWAREHGCV